MRNLLFVRIPSTCICFTVISLAVILSKLPQGKADSLFPLYLLGWLLVCQAIDWLISLIPFKRFLSYCLTESLVLYAASLTAVLLLGWVAWRPDSILLFSLIFLLADGFVLWYFKRRQQLLAQEINGLL